MKLLVPTTEVKILSTLCQACVAYTPSPVFPGTSSDPLERACEHLFTCPSSVTQLPGLEAVML